MDYKKLEVFFQTRETLEEALDYLEKPIKKITYWANLFQKGVVHDNPNEINKAIVELAGAFSDLRIALGLADHYKGDKELQRYMEIKTEIDEDDDRKFISASAEKEAKRDTMSYRRVKKIIEAHKESADKCITALQNVNNNLDKEMRKNPA